jgi:hypothetical protein
MSLVTVGTAMETLSGAADAMAGQPKLEEFSRSLIPRCELEQTGRADQLQRQKIACLHATGGNQGQKLRAR